MEPVTNTNRVADAQWLQVIVAWMLVGLPLAWGIYKTLEKALVLFR